MNKKEINKLSKLVIIGGFLGTGKTTTILSLARKLLDSGKKIGIVTNDQGSDLVDTNFLSANGLEVLAVEGSCFCCSFNEFTEKVAELRKKSEVDVLLCEPVGSCTDLIATIFKPLTENRGYILSDFSENFSLSPLVIVAEPKRITRYMKDNSDSEINYLFQKQLEEANIIAVNKCDMYDKAEIDRIKKYLAEKFKGVQVLEISAKNDINIDVLLEYALGGEFSGNALLDIDYKRYAKAEAELGWLNLSCLVASKNGETFDINAKMREYMTKFGGAFSNSDLRESLIAHLKCYAVAQNDFYKASIVDDLNANSIDENNIMSGNYKECNIIVNARIKTTPEVLRKVCEENINVVFGEFDVKYLNLECFSPKEPMPTFGRK